MVYLIFLVLTETFNNETLWSPKLSAELYFVHLQIKKI